MQSCFNTFTCPKAEPGKSYFPRHKQKGEKNVNQLQSLHMELQESNLIVLKTGTQTS